MFQRIGYGTQLENLSRWPQYVTQAVNAQIKAAATSTIVPISRRVRLVRSNSAGVAQTPPNPDKMKPSPDSIGWVVTPRVIIRKPTNIAATPAKNA